MIVKHSTKEKKLIFKIVEELDHHSCRRIRQRADYEIQRLLPKKIIFDFEKVQFMDSAGIGLVLGRYKNAKNIGSEIELINVSSKMNKVFEMAGMNKIIKIKERIS